MVVGVVDQDVEDHSAEQLAHVAEVRIAIDHAATPQQLRELRIAIAFRRGTQGNERGQAVQAPAAPAVEAPDRDCVTVGEPDRLRLRSLYPGLGRERHRRVLDQRHVGRIAGGELDDPLLAANVD